MYQTLAYYFFMASILLFTKIRYVSFQTICFIGWSSLQIILFSFQPIHSLYVIWIKNSIHGLRDRNCIFAQWIAVLQDRQICRIYQLCSEWLQNIWVLKCLTTDSSSDHNRFSPYLFFKFVQIIIHQRLVAWQIRRCWALGVIKIFKIVFALEF